MKMSNRRAFLFGSSQTAVLGGLLGGVGAPKVSAEPSGPPPLPWAYAPLDSEWVRKRVHQLYSGKECCAGSFTALIEALRDRVGAPYDTVPCDMMLYGAGGVAGFASLCGALNGSCAAISLACDKDQALAVITELLSWYSGATLPSDTSNGYAMNGGYFDDDTYTIREALPQSVAGGELCHMSVSNWCEKSGFASGSKERSERCARVAGDVAAKAVELLNALHAGEFVASTPLPADASGCRECHAKSETSSTRGKGDCIVCHEALRNKMTSHHCPFTRGRSDCVVCHADAAQSRF